MEKNIKLGLKENIYQFTLLVIVNAFVGAMIGLERTLLPEIAEKEFQMVAKTAILSFIVVFGLTKAITNYFAGRFSDRYGRKIVLIIGWLFAIPVPLLLINASTWNWIILANVFLGISQGLTWSTTVIMKIDLVGSKQRGLAMGLNEFAGYFAVAISALLTGFIASQYGLRPEPFYLGIFYVFAGTFLSIFLVKETKHHVTHEINNHHKEEIKKLSQKEIFLKTTFLDKNLSSITQAGFVNNLNDGMAWGLFPILYAGLKFDLQTIGILSAIYPASWGLLQIFTGYYSDKIGRKIPIAFGMWVQALGIIFIAVFDSFWPFVLGNLLLGIGTAMVYPTLLAAIGDVAHPSWRASSVGVYRLWRDSGYAAGAIIAGFTADYFGIRSAIWLVALMTFVSGVIVIFRMRETISKKESLSVSELKKYSNVLHLDVRSAEEYFSGHINGAIHAPQEKILEVVKKISKDTVIVTNCGKGGGRSIDAMKLLRDNGWKNTYWLEGGFRAYASNNSIKWFDAEVKKYDQWFDENNDYFEAELNAIKKLIDVKGRSLEVGIGTGRFALALGVSEGIEPADNMRLIANKKGLLVKKAIAESLPYEDSSFNAVLFITSLCFVSDAQKSVIEASRVLKSNGKIIIAFINRESALAKKYKDNHSNNPYLWANFFSVSEIKDLLEKAGFSDFQFSQTLLENETKSYLDIDVGYDEGAFIVISAIKKGEEK